MCGNSSCSIWHVNPKFPVIIGLVVFKPRWARVAAAEPFVPLPDTDEEMARLAEASRAEQKIQEIINIFAKEDLAAEAVFENLENEGRVPQKKAIRNHAAMLVVFNIPRPHSVNITTIFEAYHTSNSSIGRLMSRDLAETNQVRIRSQLGLIAPHFGYESGAARNSCGSACPHHLAC